MPDEITDLIASMQMKLSGPIPHLSMTGKRGPFAASDEIEFTPEPALPGVESPPPEM